MNEKSALDTTEPFLAVAPAFRPRWEAFLTFYDSEEEADMYTYSAMGELAHFLVDSYEAGDTGFFRHVFGVVETFLEDGDPELENLIQVGLFEPLQNEASHRAFGFAVFEHWLGPRAIPVWRQADAAMTLVQEFSRPPWWKFWARFLRFNRKRALRKVTNPRLRQIIEQEYRQEGR